MTPCMVSIYGSSRCSGYPPPTSRRRGGAAERSGGVSVFWLLSTAVLAVLVAAVVVERRRRRHLTEDVDVFQCRIRSLGPAPKGWRMLRRAWSRRVWACWTGDVLMVRRGPVLDRRVRLVALGA